MRAWQTTSRPARAFAGAGGYPLEAGQFDEAFASTGTPRRPYAEVLDALARLDLLELRERVRSRADQLGLRFGDDGEIGVDPVPRLIAGAEWEALESGLRQRARALNAFVLDVYGPRRIFDAGVVPQRLLETSPGYEAPLVGLLNPEVPPATVAGFDLVRGGDGGWMVLEDNLRMPSGGCYALGVREAVEPALEVPLRPRPPGPYAEELRRAILAAAPEGRQDPVAAILSDGPGNSAWYEHARFGREAELRILTPDQLEVSRGRLFARGPRGRDQIDVVYRRQEEDSLCGPDGRLTELGELLLPALRSGRLRCVNSFGTGIGDDKLTHAYVERMVEFYLGEEPELPSVPSYDLTEQAQREAAMERLEELVIKPRGGYGGQGVTIMPRVTEAERQRALAVVRRRPEDFIAQEPIELSSHPTACGAELRPRRVDLRPFVITGRDRQWAITGGLTRYARGAGEMVVNSSQGGGVKDTWVLAEEAR